MGPPPPFPCYSGSPKPEKEDPPPAAGPIAIEMEPPPLWRAIQYGHLISSCAFPMELESGCPRSELIRHVSSRAWQTLRGVPLVPFADFLNHDGVSDSILVYDEQKDVSEVVADRNYAVGEQVMIRYGKYLNATLALNFGFTLSRNIYDQAHILIDMSEQDPLYKKKLDIWRKHRTPKSEHMEVKYSGDKGIGIPQVLRAFVRVFYATSSEELEEMAVEAVENDGQLARRPLKHAEREVHAHRKLLLHLDNMIQGHSTALEQLEIVDGAASRSMHPFRKGMAKDLLAGELQVLQSAHAWVANYCETVNMS